ncbi:hypothetical protein BAE30_04325 [Acidithiobacillus caldus]|uniref:Uncharacterized protein n=1 Tax=Acidithiobacillus caldus TaxID=33059 RepID=A0A1E7YYL4_9PROT|nr:hypothetical protein BAE30_04325 [Acidithiobacillus caldus]
MSEDMDVSLPLEDIRRKNLRRWFIVVIIVQSIFLAIFSAVLWTSVRLPSVAGTSLELGRVHKGSFVLRIEGVGYLRPKKERWIASNIGGIIKYLYVHPGDMVKKHETLLRIVNPKVDEDVQQARYNLIQAEEKTTSQSDDLSDQLYSLESKIAFDRDRLKKASMLLVADKLLLERHIISKLQYNTERISLKDDRELVASLERRLLAFRKNMNAQRLEAGSVIASSKQLLASALEKTRDLEPRATLRGEIMAVSVQPGEHISAGTEIAKIASLHQMGALIFVGMKHMAMLEPGQDVKVVLSTVKKTILEGTVQRVSPVASHGKVRVAALLRGALPKSVKPYLPVTATIVTGKIPRTLYVKKPANIRPNRYGYVYVVDQKAKEAIRTAVHFGVAASDGIQVLSGLKPGQIIVLSNTSKWKQKMRIVQ